MKQAQLADGRVLEFPDNTPDEVIFRVVKDLVNAPKQPVQDPLTAQTNKAAIETISQAIPEPVKEAASVAGEKISEAYGALPEPVKSAARRTGNFLLDTLDYIQRPFQAVAVASKETRKLQKEQPSQPGKIEMPAAFTEQGAARIRAAAGRGLKGEEKASTQELLSDEFRKANPLKAAVLGFAGDALSDPLNVVGGAPYKVAKAAIETVPGATTIPSKLADNELFRSFNVTTGDVDKARELYNNYRYLRDKAKNEGVRDAKALNNQLKKLSKQSNIPVDELKRKIVQDIETADLSPNEIGKIEQKIIDRNKQLLEEQRAAGVEVGDLGVTYMPHVLSEQADEILKDLKQKNFYGVRPSAKSQSAIERQLEGTVAEINAKNIYGTNKFFIDDPAIMTGIAEYRAANAIAGKKFLKDVEELGVKADEAPANYVGIPEVPNLKFAPEVANLVNRSYKSLTNQQEMGKFLQVYDGALNWWKMWSLGVRPSYHTKNAIGNVWNAYLGGLKNPKTYGEAGVFQTKLARNDLTGKIAGKPVEELYEAMATRGVFGEGQYGGTEFARTLERELSPIKPTDIITPSTRNVVLRAGFKVGQTVEDNARIALFLDQVKKGASYDQAAKHVQKYLFDYGDVSQFEQGVVKRVLPFYTWSRKNIPLQLEALVRHPERVNKLNLGIENIQSAYGAEPADPSQVPSYVTEGGPVYVGQDKEAGTTSAVTLSGILPLMDLGVFTKFLNTPTTPSGPPDGKIDPAISTATSGMSPFIKGPIEYFANYDLFKKKNIEEFEGQSADLLGIKMPVHLAKALSNIVLLNEIDRLNPGSIFGTRSVDPATGVVTKTPSIFGNERGSRVDLPEEQRQTQALTGVRVFDINMSKTEAINFLKVKKDVEKLRSLVRGAIAREKTYESEQALAALDKFYQELEEIEAARKERMKNK